MHDLMQTKYQQISQMKLQPTQLKLHKSNSIFFFKKKVDEI